MGVGLHISIGNRIFHSYLGCLAIDLDQFYYLPSTVVKTMLPNPSQTFLGS